MQVQINFQNLSLVQLKQLASELNAKVQGDKRLKETWVKACELAVQAGQVAVESAKSAAQSALVKTGESVNQIAGNDVVASLSTTVQAMGESLLWVGQPVIVPSRWLFHVSKPIVLKLSQYCEKNGKIAVQYCKKGYKLATSQEAIDLYIKSVIQLFHFCCILYDMGIAARDIYEAVRPEIDEFVAEFQAPELPEGMEPRLARVLIARYFVAKNAIGHRVWALDRAYQIKVVEPVRQEVTAIFSLGEWVMGMMR